MPKRTKPVKVVTKTADVTYPKRYGRVNGEETCIDNGGKGTQIVEELDMCASCAAKKKV